MREEDLKEISDRLDDISRIAGFQKTRLKNENSFRKIDILNGALEIIEFQIQQIKMKTKKNPYELEVFKDGK
jgi:hypothetical protein